jgi:protein ImuA
VHQSRCLACKTVYVYSILVEISPVHPARATPSAVAPEAIHPALWRAAGIGRGAASGLATGFAALDAELPGGGWPAGQLTELLLPHPGVGEWRLLAPALAALQQGQDGRGRCDDRPRHVMLFDPPARPCPWTLSALGLDTMLLLVVQGHGQPRRAPRGRPWPAADTLWALEQALASGQVGAALAWLPARLPADALRRLQLAAQAHPGPVFLFREAQARLRPSAAPLRLLLAPGTPEAPDALRLRLLKRRGPPGAAPLVLALPAVLGAAARERVRAGCGRPQLLAAERVAA